MKQDKYTQWVKRKKKLRKKRKSRKRIKRCYMKLYVIGNGFDLYHGIQSNYFSFKDFLEENDPKVYDVVNTYLANVTDFWCSFEENLAYLDEDSILDHASNYLESYGAENWSDAFHHDYQFEINQIIEPLTTGLKRNFVEWANQLDIRHKKNQILDIDSSSLFLTFNYTPTLEKLYQIKNTGIKYIHGKVIDSNSNLIFGHNYVKPNDKPDLEKIRKELGEEAYNEYLDELGGQDVRVTEGNDILNSYFIDTYKPTNSIIKENKTFFQKLKNIREIVIIGHSLADVDIPYFEKIFENIDVDNTQWIVSYHDKNHIDEHRQALKNIGVKDDQIKNVKMDYFYPTNGVLFN